MAVHPHEFLPGAHYPFSAVSPIELLQSCSKVIVPSGARVPVDVAGGRDRQRAIEIDAAPLDHRRVRIEPQGAGLGQEGGDEGRSRVVAFVVERRGV